MDALITAKIGDTIEIALADRNMTINLVTDSGVGGKIPSISITAPIGAAVYGKKIGEEFSYRLPNGEIRTGKIIKILKHTK